MAGASIIEVNGTPQCPTGSLSAPGAVEVKNVAGQSVFAIQLAGTWTGTVAFEGTVDGQNWAPLYAENVATQTSATGATANGIFRGVCAGLTSIRANATAVTSGTIDVSVTTTAGSAGNAGGPVGGGGAGGTVKITDAGGIEIADVLDDAGTFRLATSADIKAGASVDVGTISNPLPAGTNNIGDVDVASSALPTGAATEATLAGYGVEDGDAIAAGQDAIHIALKDQSGNTRLAEAVYDDTEGLYRLAATAQVQITPPTPPPATTAVTIDGGSPLDITGTVDATYVITNGTTFTVQNVIAGSEGDSTEKGSVIEVLFDDGTEHLIVRQYVNGFTTQINPNRNTAIDGTSLAGNGTNEIILRRRRLSGGAQEVDALLQGYES